MSEKLWAWAILIGLIASVVAAYTIAWRAKRPASRGVASWLIALTLALAGAVCIFGYAIPALDDFSNPRVSFVSVLVGSLIVWPIGIGAFVLAARFAMRSSRAGRTK